MICVITKASHFYFVLGGSNENGSTQHTSDSAGTFISYRFVIFYINFLILISLKVISNTTYLKQKDRSVFFKTIVQPKCSS